MERNIIKIDNEKCNGCGTCIPNCHEGALQIIDGKAVLVSDLLCDGLGACLGHCPEGALQIEKREALPYDEKTVMQEMVAKGPNVVIAHLKHLKEHNETGYYNEGIQYLIENGDSVSFNVNKTLQQLHQLDKNKTPVYAMTGHSGCPGSHSFSFQTMHRAEDTLAHQSQLSHWPVQLHLINPHSGHFHQLKQASAAWHFHYHYGNTVDICFFNQ